MTALTIVQEACNEIGLSQPTAIFSSTDANVITLRTMLNTQAKLMRDAGEWVELTKEHTFSTAASTQTYNLPADYDHIVTETAWDRSDYTKMVESINGPLWQALKSGIIQTPLAVDGFRIRGHTSGQFYVDPTPAATKTLVYEYQSKNAVLTAGGTEKLAFSIDTDTFILSEPILTLGITWRFNRQKGFAYRDQEKEYDDAVNRRFGRDGGAPVIDMASGTSLWLDYPANIQEGNFLV